MKHIVYVPALDEQFDGVLTTYDGQAAVSALVDDDFVTDGVVLYEFDSMNVLLGDPGLVMDTFAGWQA